MDAHISRLLKKISKRELKKFLCRTRIKDISVEVFKESMHEYIGKLIKASEGNYDLDDYDKQVILMAFDSNEPTVNNYSKYT
jgi:hypothetical protein